MAGKSINELIWNVTEEEYRKDPAISYSTLSRFEREGWRNLAHLYDKIETPSLTFGSAVDALITDGEDAFNDRFIVCDFPPLTDSLISIARYLYSAYGHLYSKLEDIPSIYINEAADVNGYYKGDKYENFRVKKIKESCGEYYSLLKLAEDKSILSTADYEDVMLCRDELLTNSITSYLFTESEYPIEKVFQAKFKASYIGIPVRCMFDELIINHSAKVITPIDLKTTGHYEEEFQDSFVKWRYDIQSRLYTYILNEVINSDPYFKDFTIDTYRFCTINRRSKAPLIWEFPLNHTVGDLMSDSGEILRDWRSILTDLNWYLENPETKYSKDALHDEGVLQINNLKLV